MNALRKKDLLTLVACAVLFAVMQGLMMAEIIGPFWELNIVLICLTAKRMGVRKRSDLY